MDMHRDEDEVRGVVECCFSLMIPKFKVSRGLTGVDFTEMVWLRGHGTLGLQLLVAR